jgi:predicted metal-dependent hydrolase
MEVSYYCPNGVERDRVRGFVKQLSTLLESRAQKIASQQLTTNKVREQRDIAVKANTYLEVSKLLLEINIASSEP